MGSVGSETTLSREITCVCAHTHMYVYTHTHILHTHNTYMHMHIWKVPGISGSRAQGKDGWSGSRRTELTLSSGSWVALGERRLRGKGGDVGGGWQQQQTERDLIELQEEGRRILRRQPRGCSVGETRKQFQ